MNYTEFQLQYRDLLFAPLSGLSLIIDASKWREWSEDNVDESRKAIRTSGGPHAEPTDGFWNMRFMMNQGKWLADFESLFPEVVEWISRFPMNGVSTVYALVQDNPVGSANYLHFDEKVPGFRAYINADDGMFFRRLKNPDIIPTFNELNTDESLFLPDRAQAKSPHPNHAFLLGNEMAPHYVETMENSKDKITFVIQSSLPAEQSVNWDELAALLERSFVEYPEYIIRY